MENSAPNKDENLEDISGVDRLLKSEVTESEIKRRRVPRRAFRRRVGILLKGKFFIGNSWELGEGGMLLESAIGMREGQLLLLTFRIPGSGHTVVRGIVRYCHPQGAKFGVEFIGLNFQMKRLIRTYVASKTIGDDAA